MVADLRPNPVGFREDPNVFLVCGSLCSLHGVGAALDRISARVCASQDLEVKLLEELFDVFETPRGVPPQRCDDHCIHFYPVFLLW